MSAFEKRGQYYWRVKIRRKGFPEQTQSFDLKSKAEAWARPIENEMDKGTFVDRTETKKNTLGDLINRYLKEVTPLKLGKDPETLRLKALSQRPSAALQMSALSSQHIAQYRGERLKEVSAGTIIKELSHLTHAIEPGAGSGASSCPRTLCAWCDGPDAAKARDTRFIEGVAAHLRLSCDDARNPFLLPVIELAIETGMRQGDVVGLLWPQIDSAGRVAHLPLTRNGEARSVLAALWPSEETKSGPVPLG